MSTAKWRGTSSTENVKTFLLVVTLGMVVLLVLFNLLGRSVRHSAPTPTLQVLNGRVEVRSLAAPVGERFDLITVEIGATVKTYIRCGDSMVEWAPMMPSKLTELER